MKPAALADAIVQFDRMAKALNALAACQSHQDAIEKWSAFLTASTRFYNKLRGGSKGHPASWHWSDSITHQRRTDSILQYVKNARDAEDHGIGTEHAKEEYMGISIPMGSISYKGKDIPINGTPKTSYLLPVENNGVVYSPPSDMSLFPASLNLRYQDPRFPLNVGIYALEAYRIWLAQAQNLTPH